MIDLCKLRHYHIIVHIKSLSSHHCWSRFHRSRKVAYDALLSLCLIRTRSAKNSKGKWLAHLSMNNLSLLFCAPLSLSIIIRRHQMSSYLLNQSIVQLIFRYCFFFASSFSFPSKHPSANLGIRLNLDNFFWQLSLDRLAVIEDSFLLLRVYAFSSLDPF